MPCVCRITCWQSTTLQWLMWIATVPVELRESQASKFVVYPWARSIASTIGSLFFCNYYFIRPEAGKQADHVFIGKASNAQTAAYMAEYVVKSVLRESAKLYGTAIAPEARSFAVGVVNRLRERVREMQTAAENDGPKGTALVLSNLYASEKEANALWLANQGVNLRASANRAKSAVNSDAYYAGKDFGSRVSLAAGIGHSANTLKRIR